MINFWMSVPKKDLFRGITVVDDKFDIIHYYYVRALSEGQSFLKLSFSLSYVEGMGRIKINTGSLNRGYRVRNINRI